MAPGVAKSFKKIYKENIIKFLEANDLILANEDFNKKYLYTEDFFPVLNIDKYNKFAVSEFEQLKNLFSCTTNVDEDLDNKIKTSQELAYKFSVREVTKKTYQAMEGLIHNLNTMNSRAGAQCPFSSLNFGTDTSEEGRLVIEQFLLATEAGLGNGETPIFPISIYRVKEGINFNPGDPNYDLFKLAIRCSAKRLFPNFSLVDAPFNLQYYDPNRPETEIAYMG